MNLITREGLAAEAAAGWHRQYGNSFPKVSDPLNALGPAPNPDDVDRIIGNNSWTHVACDECGAESPVVQLGEAPDHESNTACICRVCLLKALALISDPAEAKLTMAEWKALKARAAHG